MTYVCFPFDNPKKLFALESFVCPFWIQDPPILLLMPEAFWKGHTFAAIVINTY